MLQLSLVVLIFSSAVVHCAQVTDSVNFVFGGCKAGKESCKECYQTLVKCLLGSDENIVNLDCSPGLSTLLKQTLLNSLP